MFGSITTCRRGFSVQTDAEEGVVFRVVSVMAGVSHTDIDTDVEVEVDVEVEGVIETTLAGVSVPTSFEFFSFAGMTATPDECGACVCCPDVVKIPNIPFLLFSFSPVYRAVLFYVLFCTHCQIITHAYTKKHSGTSTHGETPLDNLNGQIQPAGARHTPLYTLSITCAPIG